MLEFDDNHTMYHIFGRNPGMLIPASPTWPIASRCTGTKKERS